MSIYEFDDGTGTRLTGKLKAHGGATGDVPTADAKGLLSQAPGGGSMPQGVWLPDKAPASPNADDQEYATMDEGVGVPAGWTAFDPINALSVEIIGAGLKLTRTDVSGYGAFNPIPNGTFDSSSPPRTLTNGAYAFNQMTWPMKLVVAAASNGGTVTSGTVEIVGTDVHGDPLDETLPVTIDGGDATTTNDYASITSITAAGFVGLTGSETIHVNLVTPPLSTVLGIYKAAPVGDFTATFKVCSATKLDWPDVYGIIGIGFFEDATDPTKRIEILGHHWFDEMAWASYDDAYSQAGGSAGFVNELSDRSNGYIRVRRNGTSYFLDGSAQGLAFTVGMVPSDAQDYDPAELTLPFVPAHIGLVMDKQKAMVVPFLRFNDSDVGLDGVLEGARA